MRFYEEHDDGRFVPVSRSEGQESKGREHREHQAPSVLLRVPSGRQTIYAYTKEEWGLGAGSGGGDAYTIRSYYFSILATVLFFLPATLGCLFLVIVLAANLQWSALIFLLFGLIFGLGVLQGYFNIAAEWRGRKLRKLKGLPKPWFTADDDNAYEAFLKHPSPHIPLTLEYFPESRILRQEAGRNGVLSTED